VKHWERFGELHLTHFYFSVLHRSKREESDCYILKHVSFENWTINKLRPSFKCRIPHPTPASALCAGTLLLLRTAIFLSNLQFELQCLRNCRRRRVTEKSHRFYTNRRSVRDPGSKLNHLHGRQLRKPLRHPITLLERVIIRTDLCRKKLFSKWKYMSISVGSLSLYS
jgi:hypothetical protein